MTTFERWCALKTVPSKPAAPFDIALFIHDCAELGMDKIWPWLSEISHDHLMSGMADPTSSSAVTSAVARLAPIVAPRSWPNERKASFLRLPYDLQVYLSGHEAQREKEVRRAQSALAVVKKKLAEIQPAESPVATVLKQRSKNNGDQPHATA